MHKRFFLLIIIHRLLKPKKASLREQPGFCFLIYLNLIYLNLIYLDLIYLRNILEIFLNLLVTNLVILQITIEIAFVGWHINQAMT